MSKPKKESMLFRMNFAKSLNGKYLVFLDQILLSTVNFGSILVLSKITSVGVFGSFVVTYSYASFIYVFSSLFISGPILVFLAKKWNKKSGNYLIISLLINLIFNILFSLICFIPLKNQFPEVSFLTFFLLPFGMTFFDVVKKFSFAAKEVSLKFILTSTILLTLLFFLQLFFSQGLVLNGILKIYGISFLSGSLFLLGAIFSRKSIRQTFFFSSEMFKLGKQIWQTHFHYAKWIILGGIAFWGYSQGVYILAEIFDVSDFSLGKVRTLQNLLGVFSILLVALENQYTPIFAQNMKEEGEVGLKNRLSAVFKENYLKIGALFILAIPVGLFFYDKLYEDKYGVGIMMFLIFWVIQVVLVFVKPFSIFLKSIESTKPFFVSHALAAVSILIVFVVLEKLKNPYSLPISMLIANLVYAGNILSSYFYQLKKIKKQ